MLDSNFSSSYGNQGTLSNKETENKKALSTKENVSLKVRQNTSLSEKNNFDETDEQWLLREILESNQIPDQNKSLLHSDEEEEKEEDKNQESDLDDLY